MCPEQCCQRQAPPLLQPLMKIDEERDCGSLHRLCISSALTLGHGSDCVQRDWLRSAPPCERYSSGRHRLGGVSRYKYGLKSH